MFLVLRFHRKLLLPAGLISLGILPFLCCNYLLQHHHARISERMLEVTYWSKRDTIVPSPLLYVNGTFVKFNLNGKPEDKVKLHNIQLAIRYLIHQPDTTRGIEVTFEEGSKYNSLIRLFDICKAEGALTYINYKDKFWIFNLRPLVAHDSNLRSIQPLHIAL
jgi:hypothetical protein